jgi:hypothetical protein
MVYYTMEELSKAVGLTQQTLYKLRRENAIFAEVAKANSRKRGRGILYGEVVLEWLKEHYYVGGESSESATPAVNEPTLAIDAGIVAKYEGEIERLTARIAELEQQQGILLLLLSQEKQEKQALLPAPKISLWQRIFAPKKQE